MTQAIQSQQQGIQLSETALTHLNKLREEQGKDLCLRVGVRNGGCSGMSYLMDFEDPSNVREDDEVFDYDGFKIICDPKSFNWGRIPIYESQCVPNLWLWEVFWCLSQIKLLDGNTIFC